MIIYTAICGGVDELPNVEHLHEDGVRFVAFMGSKKKIENGWEILPDNKCKVEDPRRRSRWYKFHSHRLFKDEITMWIDAHIDIQVPIKTILDHMDKSAITQTVHGARNCIYKEADVCIQFHYADKKVALEQIARYEKEGMPRNYGLYQNGIILRRKSEESKKWNMGIWREYKKGCQRDQVCAQYVAWKNNINIATMPREWFKVGKHKINNRKVIS